uniref:Uncharacterized protein n=1 Tax=Chromera velia CCMP2878 TaxID=1169474 RepID=A0A0G4GCM6_9ALVE|eukprot:Cvel_4525.t1-p1 / transcript=Cvel_4525.t1 / gene=Cvel_4525 / organism=Chromera_velia_CCMP2878 / gene_product=hypothetical protein / transcript_product=hypothetical protein / location=Cvel_scaffold198:53484-57670(-) / protein_length=567 / sequence_SO=supercontig / SO=protein_coding / is_pseudo=false
MRATPGLGRRMSEGESEEPEEWQSKCLRLWVFMLVILSFLLMMRFESDEAKRQRSKHKQSVPHQAELVDGPEDFDLFSFSGNGDSRFETLSVDLHRYHNIRSPPEVSVFSTRTEKPERTFVHPQSGFFSSVLPDLLLDGGAEAPSKNLTGGGVGLLGNGLLSQIEVTLPPDALGAQALFPDCFRKTGGRALEADAEDGGMGEKEKTERSFLRRTGKEEWVHCTIGVRPVDTSECADGASRKRISRAEGWVGESEQEGGVLNNAPYPTSAEILSRISSREREGVASPPRSLKNDGGEGSKGGNGSCDALSSCYRLVYGPDKSLTEGSTLPQFCGRLVSDSLTIDVAGGALMFLETYGEDVLTDSAPLCITRVDWAVGARTVSTCQPVHVSSDFGPGISVSSTLAVYEDGYRHQTGSRIYGGEGSRSSTHSGGSLLGDLFGGGKRSSEDRAGEGKGRPRKDGVRIVHSRDLVAFWFDETTKSAVLVQAYAEGRGPASLVVHTLDGESGRPKFRSARTPYMTSGWILRGDARKGTTTILGFADKLPFIFSLDLRSGGFTIRPLKKTPLFQ